MVLKHQQFFRNQISKVTEKNSPSFELCITHAFGSCPESHPNCCSDVVASPLKVHFVRHFDSAIFVVTSRMEYLPIRSQKHLWDLYKHVCSLVSYKNIF